MHVWVRYVEVGRVDVQVVVGEDVYVYGPVVILSVHRFGGASELYLDSLCGFEQLMWRERRGYAYAAVYEPMLRAEAPWLRLDER